MARHRPSPLRPVPISIATLCAVLVMGSVAVAAVLLITVVPIGNPAPQAGAGFGTSVAGLADVTADGVPDLAIGAPGADRVYVLSGATRTVVRTIADPDGSIGNRFGEAVAAIGDVDGDSVGDLLVGAPGPSPSPVVLPCPTPPCPAPGPEYGRAFVISGRTGSSIRTLAPTEDFTGFGLAVASLGDVNGDGKPDVAVGMVPLGYASAFGRVYAFSGANGAQLWMQQEPGGRQLPSFGFRLAGIADVDADAARDLLVGAPFHDTDPDPAVTRLAGQAYILSGKTGAILRTHTSPSPADNARFGSGLTAVDDETGDGVADYAIGEPGAGVVHLFNGASGAPVRQVTSPGASGDLFGLSLAGTGDQNADTKPDFWVGAPGSGRAYLADWNGTVLVTVIGPAPAPSALGFGWSLSTTGNLGGDGPPDLLVGNPGHGDSAGADSGAASLVWLTANRPPDADAGPDQVVECGSPSGTLVTLDGSRSSDPDGDALSYVWRDASNAVIGASAKVNVSLGLGTHVFTVVVDDGKGGSDSDTVSIVVRDTTPPRLSVALSPQILWPPNHRLVQAEATVLVADACDASPAVTLLSVLSSEPDDARGDGSTGPDIVGAAPGVDDRVFFLRAERSGAGQGRVYTARYRAVDASGNVAQGAAQVVVPHHP